MFQEKYTFTVFDNCFCCCGCVVRSLWRIFTPPPSYSSRQSTKTWPRILYSCISLRIIPEYQENSGEKVKEPVTNFLSLTSSKPSFKCYVHVCYRSLIYFLADVLCFFFLHCTCPAHALKKALFRPIGIGLLNNSVEALQKYRIWAYN